MLQHEHYSVWRDKTHGRSIFGSDNSVDASRRAKKLYWSPKLMLTDPPWGSYVIYFVGKIQKKPEMTSRRHHVTSWSYFSVGIEPFVDLSIMLLPQFPLPLPPNQPPSGYRWEERDFSASSSTTAFITGIDGRDKFLGRKRCVICGLSASVVLEHRLIIGQAEPETTSRTRA